MANNRIVDVPMEAVETMADTLIPIIEALEEWRRSTRALLPISAGTPHLDTALDNVRGQYTLLIKMMTRAEEDASRSDAVMEIIKHIKSDRSEVDEEDELAKEKYREN